MTKGAKWSMTVLNGTKHDQMESKKVKQMGQTGANWAKQGQKGPNGAIQCQTSQMWPIEAKRAQLLPNGVTWVQAG